MSKKLSLTTETVRTLTSTEIGGVVGGASYSSARQPVHKAPVVRQAPAHDNGKAAFMRIWRQIAEQQSGSYR